MGVLSDAIIYRILKETRGAPPFPPIIDRKAWTALASHSLAESVRSRAREVLGQAIAFLPATLYLDFSRTGRRAPYEKPYFERRYNLSSLVLAECMENEGRYLDGILDLIWAICEETSWVIPAHARRHDHLLPTPEEVDVDLFSAGTGLVLAEMDFLLGDKLMPHARRRIRSECSRRITDVYLRDPNLRWLGATGAANNWNAVCNAGVTGVALYLEDDVMVQARVLTKALATLQSYLHGFDEEGSTPEGVGYWGYGFGHYAIFSHLVEGRTEGQIPLLSGERFQKICRFPVQMEMSPGRFVNFSDATEETVLQPGICCWLSRRCNVPELGVVGHRHLSLLDRSARSNSLTYLLRDLVWTDQGSTSWQGHVPTAFYKGHQWLVSRFAADDSNTLVLAAKGGHNEEFHNQNDVGQFIVHVNGESVVLDLGRQIYTREYFGPRRYEILECRSGGHNVPVVNGLEQPFGRQYEATLLDTIFSASADTMTLELSKAYTSEAGLERLVRRVSLLRERPKGAVVVYDTYGFKNAPGEFQSRVHTLANVEKAGPGYLRLSGAKASVSLQYNPSSVKLEIVEIPPAENSTWAPVLRQIRLTQQARDGSVELRFVPE